MNSNSIFTLRSENDRKTLTNAQLKRQQKLLQFIRNPDLRPETRNESVQLAILNNSNLLDAVTVAIIYKSLNLFKKNFKFHLGQAPSAVEISEIKRYLSKYDVTNLTCFPLTNYYNIKMDRFAPVRNFSKIKFDTAPLSRFTTFDFERALFGNNVKVRANERVNISKYLYMNLQNYLTQDGKISSSELDKSPPPPPSSLPQPYGGDGAKNWRFKILKFIELFDFNDKFTVAMFKFDKIMYKGVQYDVSFVPKYDLTKLQLQLVNGRDLGEIYTGPFIRFYDNEFKPNTTTYATILPAQRSIFKIFPFKSGYFVDFGTGIVHRVLDVARVSNASTNAYISNTCDVGNLEESIASLARILSFDEVFSAAVYSENLKRQAIALLILRHKNNGGHLIINETIVFPLPQLNDILGWVKWTIEKPKIVLPIPFRTANTPMYINLIRDLSLASMTKIDVAFYCSNFFVPCCEFKTIFDALANDSEKYVLLTLVLQQFPNADIYRYREQLQPTFHFSEMSAATFRQRESKYENFIKRTPHLVQSEHNTDRNYDNMRLVDANSEMLYCTPLNCPERYKFHDDRLNALIESDSDHDPFDRLRITLAPMELSRFIYVELFHRMT